MTTRGCVLDCVRLRETPEKMRETLPPRNAGKNNKGLTMEPTKPLTNQMITSIDDPDFLRAIKGNPSFENAELFPSAPNGHKFAAGQTCTLVGLESFPEYNGEKVTITSIREDGHHGKAYYISGRINEVMNWVYEYRLSPAVQS